MSQVLHHSLLLRLALELVERPHVLLEHLRIVSQAEVSRLGGRRKAKAPRAAAELPSGERGRLHPPAPAPRGRQPEEAEDDLDESLEREEEADPRARRASVLAQEGEKGARVLDLCAETFPGSTLKVHDGGARNEQDSEASLSCTEAPVRLLEKQEI